MKIIEMPVSKLKPYEKNPRRNHEAVEPVANSIKTFGFRVPIVIDKDNVIICGHTRYKAAQTLKMKTVPCVMADDLTPEQVRAYRLADNKTGELAGWDFELLNLELEEIGDDLNMADFGFLNHGLSDEAIDDFFEDPVTPQDEEAKKKTITCPHCGQSFDV